MCIHILMNKIQHLRFDAIPVNPRNLWKKLVFFNLLKALYKTLKLQTVA